MKILVTGGAGFIGRHLCRALLQEGHEVIALDNFSTGRDGMSHQFESWGDRFAMVAGDVSDAVLVEDLCEGCQAVYHLAATVGVAKVMADPMDCFYNNLQATEVLLTCVPMKTLIVFASTSEIYGVAGVGASGYHEEDRRVYGPTSIDRWIYAESKAIDEYMLYDRQKRGGPCVVARIFNCVGPGQRHEFGMVVPRFVRAALAGEPIKIFGDGQQIRTYCDVRDTVRAFVAFGRATPEQTGTAYNVGSSRPLTVLDLADNIITILGSTSQIEFVAPPYTRYEDCQCRVPCTWKIERAFGWKPEVSLEQTIIDTANAIRNEDF